MKYFRMPLASLFLAGLSACSTASGGNQALKTATPASINQTLHNGVTTDEQVKAIYGAPDKVSYTDSGNEIWTYTYGSSSDKIADAEVFDPTGLTTFLGSKNKSHIKTLTVLIHNGIVMKHNLNDNTNYAGTGVFKQ